MLVEIQALAVPSQLAMPRRVANGIDYNRLQLLVAILQKRLNIPIGTFDIFVNVSGGMKIEAAFEVVHSRLEERLAVEAAPETDRAQRVAQSKRPSFDEAMTLDPLRRQPLVDRVDLDRRSPGSFAVDFDLGEQSFSMAPHHPEARTLRQEARTSQPRFDVRFRRNRHVVDPIHKPGARLAVERLAQPLRRRAPAAVLAEDFVDQPGRLRLRSPLEDFQHVLCGTSHGTAGRLRLRSRHAGLAGVRLPV